jgi:hypothetical protein
LASSSGAVLSLRQVRVDQVFSSSTRGTFVSSTVTAWITTPTSLRPIGRRVGRTGCSAFPEDRPAIASNTRNAESIPWPAESEARSTSISSTFRTRESMRTPQQDPCLRRPTRTHRHRHGCRRSPRRPSRDQEELRPRLQCHHPTPLEVLRPRALPRRRQERRDLAVLGGVEVTGRRCCRRRFSLARLARGLKLWGNGAALQRSGLRSS